MIGVGIVTYDREEQFQRIAKSISQVDHIVAIKDGGKDDYSFSPSFEFIKQSENKSVGFCKNIAIDYLLDKNCEHIFLLEDDCLVKDNKVWEYCISFSKESGLLHFNWNDYRYERSKTVMFQKHKAAICFNTEANFSYFHRKFLEKIRFDTKFKNAWEHVDLEIQGERLGFLPPFRTFISPSDLKDYLEIIDNDKSTISGTENHKQFVSEGYNYLRRKWNIELNKIAPVSFDVFYNRMKEITIKYADRNSN